MDFVEKEQKWTHSQGFHQGDRGRSRGSDGGGCGGDGACGVTGGDEAVAARQGDAV